VRKKNSVRPPKAGARQLHLTDLDIARMIDFAKYLGLEMPPLTIRLRAPRIGVEEISLPPSAARQ
jgi:hypothetical protein